MSIAGRMTIIQCSCERTLAFQYGRPPNWNGVSPGNLPTRGIWGNLILAAEQEHRNHSGALWGSNPTCQSQTVQDVSFALNPKGAATGDLSFFRPGGSGLLVLSSQLGFERNQKEPLVLPIFCVSGSVPRNPPHSASKANEKESHEIFRAPTILWILRFLLHHIPSAKPKTMNMEYLDPPGREITGQKV